ncbi:MAG: hypothetical protein KKA19_09795 [Candidatus Margulisbacteria bacterium]|nr:hypothetical protein [Candidatus Margulisiibacteriota bacterium]
MLKKIISLIKPEISFLDQEMIKKDEKALSGTNLYISNYVINNAYTIAQSLLKKANLNNLLEFYDNSIEENELYEEVRTLFNHEPLNLKNISDDDKKKIRLKIEGFTKAFIYVAAKTSDIIFTERDKIFNETRREDVIKIDTNYVKGKLKNIINETFHTNNIPENTLEEITLYMKLLLDQIAARKLNNELAPLYNPLRRYLNRFIQAVSYALGLAASGTILNQFVGLGKLIYSFFQLESFPGWYKIFIDSYEYLISAKPMVIGAGTFFIIIINYIFSKYRVNNLYEHNLGPFLKKNTHQYFFNNLVGILPKSFTSYKFQIKWNKNLKSITKKYLAQKKDIENINHTLNKSLQGLSVEQKEQRLEYINLLFGKYGNVKTFTEARTLVKNYTVFIDKKYQHITNLQGRLIERICDESDKFRFTRIIPDFYIKIKEFLIHVKEFKFDKELIIRQ